jgi:methylated-DNA-protein-cysteine methyltransferase related protein
MEHNDSFQAILNVLGSVPLGRVCTYGKIAELAGCPGKSRYVGYILKNLPSDSTLPWHRIINAQGHISFPLHSDRYALQRSLLENEGIHFLHDRINLRTFLWQG